MVLKSELNRVSEWLTSIDEQYLHERKKNSDVIRILGRGNNWRREKLFLGLNEDPVTNCQVRNSQWDILSVPHHSRATYFRVKHLAFTPNILEN